MRIKKNFVLRRITEAWVILPLAEETVNFAGMLNLNETGAMLWRLLEKGADRDTLVQALTSEYAVSTEQAQEDIEEYLNKLFKVGVLLED